MILVVTLLDEVSINGSSKKIPTTVISGFNAKFAFILLSSPALILILITWLLIKFEADISNEYVPTDMSLNMNVPSAPVVVS